MCDLRQLFFFQCGSETPEVWTPLLGPTKSVHPNSPDRQIIVILEMK